MTEAPIKRKSCRDEMADERFGKRVRSSHDCKKSGSPPKKKVRHEAKKPDIDKISDGTVGPTAGGKKTTIVDTGGKGDCGWRALAYAISFINKPDLQENLLMEKLSTLQNTETLRSPPLIICFFHHPRLKPRKTNTSSPPHQHTS